jgi:hypothetical protein
MSETCYNVPPDRDVIVLDQGTPSATAAALIAAAVAAGYPVNSVRYQPETGGFLVPAGIANTEVPDPPVLTGLAPATASITDPDFEGHLHGTGFVDGSVIVWNNADEPTRFVDETDIWTTVVPSVVTSPTTVEVYVRNPDGQTSDVLTFTWTGGGDDAGGAGLPIALTDNTKGTN